MSRNTVPPYRKLAIYIIWQAILDQDEAFFYTPWFEELADVLGYSAEGMRELALEKMAQIRRRGYARRRRRPRTKENGNGVGRS